MSQAPTLLRHAADLSDLCNDVRRRGFRVGFVPTMGALHHGHLTLAREARSRASVVVASIFVNPTQFGANEDLSRYPRDLEGDLRKLASVGVAAVFAPGRGSSIPPGKRRGSGSAHWPSPCAEERAPGTSRGRDRRRKALRHRRPQRRSLREEGLPAASRHPSDGSRSVCPCRDRRHPDRARGGRSRDELAQRVPLAR